MFATSKYTPSTSPSRVTGHFCKSEFGYRYRFNGQEQDNEVAGAGNIMFADFWMYDTRMGRRWNLDVVIRLWESPYATFKGNPIFFNDPLGASPEGPDNDNYDNGPAMQDDGKKPDGSLIAELGKLPERGTSEDSKYGFNGAPKTEAGFQKLNTIYSDLLSMSDNNLLREMSDLKNLYNGERVLNHFKQNSGNMLVTNIPQAENPNGPAWNNLIKQIGLGLFNKSIKIGSFDPNKITFINEIDKIYFDGSSIFKDPSYTAILGGTQQVNIYCHSLKPVYRLATIDSHGHSKSGYYGIEAEVEIVIFDWFGVQEDDFAKTSFSTWLGGKSLAAFWVLQHQRGYKPFVNKYVFRSTITYP